MNTSQLAIQKQENVEEEIVEEVPTHGYDLRRTQLSAWK